MNIAKSVKVAVAASVIGCAAGAAMAEPDVIYGNINDVANYGPIGGVRAYMFGTYTCNRGNTNLAWLSDGTPGVGFNAYRLYNGRLQQVGQSWVKTACCAAASTDAANCGGLTGCNGQGGSVLGAGCRDYYWASYNAIQGNLSPRSGINAFAGTFPTIPGGSFNSIDRELQIAEADMNPANFPGSQFFVEGVYVASDEVTDATKNNNCSYRRAAFAAGTYAVSLSGATTIGEPAIKAWRLNGNGVGVPDTRVEDGVVQVGGDGRFFYASKVTDLGGGSWRYDYAIFNQNSHRSARALSLPVPAGVSVTDIGFSDVAYHSGEPFSGTDWSGAKVGSEVAWATQTYAENVNANALRWGTMYNFWFTANQAPVLANATLSLFRPPTGGSPATTVSFAVRVPGVPPCRADFNGVNGVTVQDIYDFLAQWNLMNPSADYNGVGGVTVQDIYDFLGDWNLGCP